ncbi:MAG: precorrin-6A reductase [Tindallia sp. MSAO_Bac2]|nr:MAG: precorrin-6A reductase [Tindallia sp. MSAO_Bac2]
MILILSGTSEGKMLVAELNQRRIPCIATTVTTYGGQLILKEIEGSNSSLQVGALDKPALEELIRQKKIRAIVDATHPYASNITWMAYEQAKALNLPYLRWHRPGLTEKEKESCIQVQDYEAAAKELKSQSGNWLLTTGSNHLEVFCQHTDIKRLMVRVMPFSKVLEKCADLGFSPGQIIAQQGPFSYQMNCLHLQEYNLAGLVTKDSGETGAVGEKLLAARDLNRKVILIQRPPEPAAQKAENMEQFQDFLLLIR